jgi:DNA-binding MarR family transcriptional regulator
MVEKINEEQIGEQMVSLFPLVKKMLLSSSDTNIQIHISNLRYRVLGMLVCNESLQMSEIGKRLGTSKPHTSSLINSMVNENLVQRVYDKKDKRIIHIVATKKGIIYLKKFKEQVKRDITKNIAVLSEKDKRLMDNSLKTLRKILLKLNSGENNENK